MKLSSVSHLFCWVPALRPVQGVRSLVRTAMSNTPFNDGDALRLRLEVEKLYRRVATNPGGEFHFHRGAEYAANLLGYDRAALAALPQTSTASFAGVGNPHVIAPLRVGEIVLDVGSGAGTDLLLAARSVGASGRAIGVDMTEAMVQRCQTAIVESGLDNVEIKRGDAENLPLDDATVDVVISNGVLNLVPNKERAFQEIYRVLRPGGRFLLGDIVLSSGLGRLMRCSIDLWTLCVGGALQEEELVALVTHVGFEQVRVTQHFDCIQGTAGETIAHWLGVSGMNLYAMKPTR